MRYALLLALLALAGCTETGQIMDGVGGTYWISSYASGIEGGAFGANDAAYAEANAFCGKAGKHAIVLDNRDRDLVTSNGNPGFLQPGRTTMHFQCS